MSSTLDVYFQLVDFCRSYPRSGDSQGQETILSPFDKQIRTMTQSDQTTILPIITIRQWD